MLVQLLFVQLIADKTNEARLDVWRIWTSVYVVATLIILISFSAINRVTQDMKSQIAVLDLVDCFFRVVAECIHCNAKVGQLTVGQVGQFRSDESRSPAILPITLSPCEHRKLCRIQSVSS